ncbi:cytidylyltransferase domain-containing protein [Rickettsiales bacterium LUAb2]
MAKIIALIPARGGSKSIPLKNIKNLAGKPLIYWCLKAASSCSLINEVHLATDHENIKSTTINFKLPKVSIYDRNSVNANDTASTESVLLEFIDNNNFNDDDLLILIQATSPFTTSKDLTSAVDQLRQSKSDSLLSCVKTKRFFWHLDGTPINYDYNKRPRRQDFAGYFMENGAFYINSIKNIKKNQNRLSGKISIFEMPEFTGLELDEPDDWLIAEQFMKANNLL